MAPFSRLCWLFIATNLISSVYSLNQTVTWGACEFPVPANSTILCGNLTVPLDYTDPLSNDTLRLELAKVPASKAPYRGSILINFGGPGGESRKTLSSAADQLQL